jgi:hypothetical protein
MAVGLLLMPLAALLAFIGEWDLLKQTQAQL